MASYNTIILHRVIEGQSKSFIDITLQTFQHILKGLIVIGRLVSIDQVTGSSTLKFTQGIVSSVVGLGRKIVY